MLKIFKCCLYWCLVYCCLFFLSGCSMTVEKENTDTKAVQEDEVGQEDGTVWGSGQEVQTGDVSDKSKTGVTGLTMANPTGEMHHCNTEDGYYYITESSEELKDGAYGYHLMYVDFATRQEIYLCSNAECSHDTPDCSAVFDAEEFGNDSCLFIYGDRLYLLSRDYDMDGSMSVDYNYIGDDTAVLPEKLCATLYSMNLDGSHREKVYTFDSKYTVEDRIMMDEQGIYVVEKILSTEQKENNTYTTSAQSALMRIDVNTGTAKEVCSLDMQDGNRRNIMGCYGEYLVLFSTRYDRELSPEEEFDDEIWKKAYASSQSVYETLSVETGDIRTVKVVSNADTHSSAIKDDKLYLGIEGTGSIQEVNLTTGEERKLADVKCNDIHYITDEAVCCFDYGGDDTMYSVMLDTGEVFHSGLVNKSLGWALELLGETRDSMLVVYDYDATPAGDDSYEINQYKMALIAKEDLYQGRDAFQAIQMISSGQ